MATNLSSRREIDSFDRQRHVRRASEPVGHGIGAARALSVRLELQPSGLAWLYAPLALLVMRRQERKNMARIKGALESRVLESRVLESASAPDETFVASRRDRHPTRG